MSLRWRPHPYLYEINARVWLNELSDAAGRRVSLADVPDAELDRLQTLGFDFVWLMGVWTTGAAGREIARAHPDLRPVYDEVLPGWTDELVLSSPYAIAGYHVSLELGGPEALAALRERLASREIGLILDFVPNHVAIDHPWVADHPEWFLHAPATSPDGHFIRVQTALGERLVAHGRDPYFPPWTDTVQLNYRNRGLRRALVRTLKEIAGQCDGVRCDMAMLVLDDIFDKTWTQDHWAHQGEEPIRGEFWHEAIQELRQHAPGFIFLAEAYWGLEWQLQQLGFDFTYDKTFYDRVCHETGATVRAHLFGDRDYHYRKARFLENHDEPRAARVLPLARHRAAAVLQATLPGMRFFHEGQLEGRRVRIPVQLARRPPEPVDPELERFYQQLFQATRDNAFRIGVWQMLDVRSATANPGEGEHVIAYQWGGGPDGQRVVVVNYDERTVRVQVRVLPALRFHERMSDRLLHFAAGEAGSFQLPLELGPYQYMILANT